MARKVGASSVIRKGGDKKLYRNVGISSLVLGGQVIEPGQEFSASLTPEFETRRLMSGHIELIRDQSIAADKADADAADGVEKKNKK